MFNKLTSNKSSVKIFTFLFLLMILSDFIMKFINVTNFIPYFRYSGALKILFECYLLIHLFKKGIKKQDFVLLTLLIFCFFLGQVFLEKVSIFNQNFIEEILIGDIYHLNKYIIIILFISTVNNSDYKVLLSDKLIRLLIDIMIINSFLIIIGLIFDVNIFSSFPGSSRFGYSGLFTKSGESVLLYLLLIVYFYAKFLKGKSILPVIYFILIAILSGKKIALLIIPLLFTIHFCLRSKYKVYFSIIGLFIISIIIFFKRAILDFLFNSFPFWEKILIEKGIWAVITSTRNLNLLKTQTFVENNWSFVNYIFGGVDYNNSKIEIDPLDLFMFFGFVGGIFYLLFLTKNFLILENKYLKILIIGFLVLGMLYGAFLFNIILMSIVFLVILNIQSEEEKVKNRVKTES